MLFRLSAHSEKQMARRGIRAELLQNVLSNPGQKIPQDTETEIWQSKMAG
jgi:hypothetical protein